eukprot:3192889-Pyramimonas_sp.AAC.1
MTTLTNTRKNYTGDIAALQIPGEPRRLSKDVRMPRPDIICNFWQLSARRSPAPSCPLVPELFRCRATPCDPCSSPPCRTSPAAPTPAALQTPGTSPPARP